MMYYSLNRLPSFLCLDETIFPSPFLAGLQNTGMWEFLGKVVKPVLL